MAKEIKVLPDGRPTPKQIMNFYDFSEDDFEVVETSSYAYPRSLY